MSFHVTSCIAKGCKDCEVINIRHSKFGCLQFLLKRNNVKVLKKNSTTFIVGLVLILWNGLLFIQ